VPRKKAGSGQGQNAAVCRSRADTISSEGTRNVMC
jgi:hypothetical protein